MSYQEEEITKLREQAKTYGKKFAEQKKLSKQALREKRKLDADRHLTEARRFEKLKKKSNDDAADLLFNLNNQHRYLDEVDLHGLYTNEALKKLEERLKEVKEKKSLRLTVITGQGHHSKGEPKLKPAVIGFAGKNKIQWKENIKNPGRISFEFAEHVPKPNYRPPVPPVTPRIQHAFEPSYPQPHVSLRMPEGLDLSARPKLQSGLKILIFFIVVFFGIYIVGKLLSDLFNSKGK